MTAASAQQDTGDVIMTTELKEAMQSVLDLQRHWTAHTTPEMQARGELIRNRIPTLLRSIADARQYKVQASAGAGSNNRVPWVRVFRSEMSPSPQEGWYVAFLFAADGSAVFISLIQGTTDWSSGIRRPKDQEALAARSGRARNVLMQSGLDLEGLSRDIQLCDPDLGKTYERGTVFAVAYRSEAIPSDEAITRDVSRILDLLELVHKERADVEDAGSSIGSDHLASEDHREGTGLGAANKRTWIFQANPLFYNIAEAVNTLKAMHWLVNRYRDQINIGDQVYLWRSGEDAGIVAKATVLSRPESITIDAEELSFAVQPEKFRGTQTRVRLSVDKVVRPVLPKDELKSDPRLTELSILNFSQGTNFPVMDDEAAAIAELIAGQQEELDEVDKEQLGRTAGISAAGRVWLYAPGKGAEHWEEFYRDGIMAVGWDDLGDLRRYAGQESFTAKIIELYRPEGRPFNDSRACFDFVHSIRPGDRVIVKKGRSIVVGYGVVTGDYEHRPARGYFKNVRTVRWDGRGNWTGDGLVLPLKTLTDFTPYPETVVQIDTILGLDKDQPPAPRPTALPPYTIEQALYGIAFERAAFENILRVWQSKNNLILQGPPGVGKTFLSRRLAYALIGYELPSRVGMVQFHQSYAYEDFIQGYRPASSGFERRDGVFVRFCNKAKADQESRYVFVIDEINRGNLSKVFGELLMLIEKDYRGSQNSVTLTYSSKDDEQFYVPKNVFILGMMNTADRSLALVDYALRRRFAFERLPPMFGHATFREFLEGAGTDPLLEKALSSRLLELNKEISADPNLGQGFCIGHSYFCRQNAALSVDDYFDAVRNEILPLLEEYWLDDRDRLEKWKETLLAAL